MAPRFDVIGIGENSVDYVYTVAQWPSPASSTSKLPILARAVRAGGQVATAMCTCATLGLRTAYVGAFGDDDNGRLVRAALDERGVDTSFSTIRQAPNRYAVIVVDARSGERLVLWQRDETLALSASAVNVELVQSTRVLHVDNVDSEHAIHAASLARAARVEVTTDVDGSGPRDDALVASATLPILGEYVPGALTGETDLERALRQLRRSHHRMLCTTLGANGAALLDGDVFHLVAAPRVGVVDTTGAGDVFRGAFIYAWLRGDSPLDSVRFANAVAAASCTRPGAIDSIPRHGEVTR